MSTRVQTANTCPIPTDAADVASEADVATSSASEPKSAQPKGPGESDRIESAPEQPSDNAWVRLVKEGQEQIADVGAEHLTQADHDENQAQMQKLLQDQKAAAAMARGDYFGAAMAKMTGYARYADKMSSAIEHTTKAAEWSVAQGLLDVARGDKTAVQKVAIGAAIATAIPSGGASLSTVEGLGTAYTAYEVTDHVGELARARTGGEAGSALGKLGLDIAFSSGAGKVVEEHLAEPLAEAVGLKELTRKASQRLADGIVSVALHGSDEVARGGMDLATALLEHSQETAETVFKLATEKGLHHMDALAFQRSGEEE